MFRILLIFYILLILFQVKTFSFTNFFDFKKEKIPISNYKKNKLFSSQTTAGEIAWNDIKQMSFEKLTKIFPDMTELPEREISATGGNGETYNVKFYSVNNNYDMIVSADLKIGNVYGTGWILGGGYQMIVNYERNRGPLFFSTDECFMQNDAYFIQDLPENRTFIRFTNAIFDFYKNDSFTPKFSSYWQERKTAIDSYDWKYNKYGAVLGPKAEWLKKEFLRQHKCLLFPNHEWNNELKEEMFGKQKDLLYQRWFDYTAVPEPWKGRPIKNSEVIEKNEKRCYYVERNIANDPYTGPLMNPIFGKEVVDNITYLGHLCDRSLLQNTKKK